jgi:membrane protease YdiL (CAAX protease family)
METTSSPTSERPSNGFSVRALSAWLVVVAIQVGLAFWSQTLEGSDTEPLYEYDLAIGSFIAYGILIGISLWIASAYQDRAEALGLRPYAWRWLGIAVGVVIVSIILAAALEPLLHAGEEQGLSPDEWRPERANAFLLNSIVLVTLTPFAEELFFRGLGVRVLGFLGSTGAMVGTALAFGLAHGLLVALPALVVLGLGLAWVRIRAESVWPGVIAHAAYNGVALAILFATLE